jgi:hypothetical protein
MKSEPLAARRELVLIGKPLPFGICDAEGRLLLARGQVLQSPDQLESLIDRGAWVIADPGAEAAERVAKAKPHQLPGHWQDSLDQVGRVLRSTPSNQFQATLDQAVKPIAALVERDADLAILQIVGDDDPRAGHYASRHAMHAAITTQLAVRRLGWEASTSDQLFRAALTMNLGMAELQNRLATQVSPPTELQKQQIRDHPLRSAELLEAAGVASGDWIQAVAQHHERPDGSGYPRGLTDVAELAWVLSRVDAFTAKFAARSLRPALAADVAVRQFFQSSPQDPVTAAIVKEFGLYPPGCVVRLKTGEVGIVMRRGETAATPLVVVLRNAAGDVLPTPLRRDTARSEHAVAAVLPAQALRVRLPLERLIAARGD